jgi:hypothetical protein
MKTRLRELLKSFCRNVLGIQIKRVKNKPPKTDLPALKMECVHDPVYSYMVDQEYKDRLIHELAEIADDFRASDTIPSHTNTPSLDIITDFFRIYTSRKHTDNTHGSGFHNSFWLYYLARVLDPELIVESGVWKGHSSWLMSKACPNANLYGFDICLDKLAYPDLNAQMFERDWQSFSFPSFDPERALIFFDCHINHAQRLIEAKSKGFKHLLFDDNPPTHKIFSHVPGIPTAAMLNSGDGLDKTEISWVWNGKSYTAPINPEQAHQAKALIKNHVILPDVGGPTRYSGFAFLTYVQI